MMIAGIIKAIAWFLDLLHGNRQGSVHRNQDIVLCLFNETIRDIVPTRSAWIGWSPPSCGLKLNIDGSFLCGIGAIGGLIRNNSGDCIAYFLGPITGHTSLDTEIESLTWSILHLNYLWKNTSIIESDCMVLVESLAGIV